MRRYIVLLFLNFPIDTNERKKKTQQRRRNCVHKKQHPRKISKQIKLLWFHIIGAHTGSIGCIAIRSISMLPDVQNFDCPSFAWSLSLFSPTYCQMENKSKPRVVYLIGIFLPSFNRDCNCVLICQLCFRRAKILVFNITHASSFLCQSKCTQIPNSDIYLFFSLLFLFFTSILSSIPSIYSWNLPHFVRDTRERHNNDDDDKKRW